MSWWGIQCEDFVWAGGVDSSLFNNVWNHCVQSLCPGKMPGENVPIAARRCRWRSMVCSAAPALTWMWGEAGSASVGDHTWLRGSAWVLSTQH